MKCEDNKDNSDEIQRLKQSYLYRNFCGLQLEIKQIYLKLFEENIQQAIQQQNQKQIEISEKQIEISEKQIEISENYIEYINSEYQIYIQDLQQQNIEPNEYLLEYHYIPIEDEIFIQSKNNIKFINQGDLDFYEQSNLFKKTIQIDTIKFNNKNIMHLKQFQIITYQDKQEIVQERFSYFLKFKDEKDNYKYNQNISDPEFRILNNPKMMLNTNIIDGYMNYLQIQDEINYFSLPPSKRKQYKRLILFPSSLITNCILRQQEPKKQEFIKSKFLCLFLEQIKQFSAIQYKFWRIYQKIGFVVNSSNFHWQFIEVKVDDRLLVLYDSQFTHLSSQVVFFFNTVFQALTKDMNFQFQVEKKQNFLKQWDGTSCGYYACIAANYLSQLQLDENIRYKIMTQMRFELLELFFPNRNLTINDNISNQQ
ncbi:unnamed protein product [Paramecium primaurelia]|uniref:Ubiquitin-like protease family profile domain-containing protein n=1 Tax=Paramecium primaurelia TaxID=5886 RepID=A0A8S1P462_PARPR|nr:unnamed protein product [Paramecium primaurelia]